MIINNNFLIGSLILAPLLALYITDYDFPIMRICTLVIGTIIFFNKPKEAKFRQTFLWLFAASCFYIIPEIFSSPIRASFISLFFALMFVLDNSTMISPVKNETSFFRKPMFFIIGFSILLLAKSVDERFAGFSSSATTYSTYLLCIYCTYLFTESKKRNIVVVSIITLWLIVLSETRTSLMLFFLVLLIWTFKKSVQANLSRYIFLALSLAIMYYPAVIAFENIDILNRYEGGIDYSKATRLAMFNNQIEALKQIDIVNFLFGYGIDENLKIGGTYLNQAIDQHNDFFALLYDFGILFFVLFFFSLYRKIVSPFSLAIFVIYIFSFYHNMIFDIYLISIFFLVSKLATKKNKEREYTQLKKTR